MYAITFDLDTNCLGEEYHVPSANNAYADIRKFLLSKDFEWVQGSVYFGGNSITAVTCVITIQELGKAFPWFTACIRDVRMLRIEENNDLMPALGLS